jgi:DNA-binding response OmpR family regulator
MKILIIEDDYNSLRIYTYLCEREGIKYDVCHTIEQSIERLNNIKYDIVLLDICIQGDLSINLLDKYPNQKFIIISGVCNKLIMNEISQKNNVVEYRIKPISKITEFFSNLKIIINDGHMVSS